MKSRDIFYTRPPEAYLPAGYQIRYLSYYKLDRKSRKEVDSRLKTQSETKLPVRDEPAIVTVQSDSFRIIKAPKPIDFMQSLKLKQSQAMKDYEDSLIVKIPLKKKKQTNTPSRFMSRISEPQKVRSFASSVLARTGANSNISQEASSSGEQLLE